MPEKLRTPVFGSWVSYTVQQVPIQASSGSTAGRPIDKVNSSIKKNVNYCLNTNIYSYLETSGGQSYDLYLSVVHFFSTSVN
jgi:hypothetical protein